MENKLEILGVSKTYANGTHALKDVNLTLKNGMFGLLGPNGAGKSSLMRTLAGLQKPSSGRILFNGTDAVAQPEAIRRHLGYLPQEFGVYPRMTAPAFLDGLALLKGITQKTERKARIDHLLQQTNLADFRKKALGTYSGGMRQRLGIAQALLGNPRILVVDEPTAGLDPEERNRFHNLLSEVGQQVIVLLSTHIVEDVRNLCPRMGLIIQGKMVRTDSPDQLIADLEGQVWEKSVDRSELDSLHQDHLVLSERHRSGQLHVQVLAPACPAPGFVPLSPNLEHVYFAHLNQIQP